MPGVFLIVVAMGYELGWDLIAATQLADGSAPARNVFAPSSRPCPARSCRSHRFAVTPEGEPGLHYQCAGDRKFFRHIRKCLRAMATLIENDLPASAVMQAIDGPLIITRNTERAS